MESKNAIGIDVSQLTTNLNISFAVSLYKFHLNVRQMCQFDTSFSSFLSLSISSIAYDPIKTRIFMTFRALVSYVQSTILCGIAFCL